MSYLASIRKAIIALAGVLANVLALNVLPAHYQAIGSVIASVLTLIGVHQVPNVPAPGTVPALEPAPNTSSK